MLELKLVQAFPFEFYGSRFTVQIATDGHLYVRLGDICDAMGVSLQGQRGRILNDVGMSRYLVYIMADTVYKEGVRRQEVMFLNIKALPYWLGSIDHKRLKPEVQERVAQFKIHFVDAVWSLFRSDILPPEIRAERDTYLPPEERELANLQDQVRDFSRRLDKLEGQVSKIDATMEVTSVINVQQQWQLQEMINAVAEALFESKKGKLPKTQCFAMSHNDFKTTFRVPVYSMLPAEKMEEAVNYLAQRYQHLKPGGKLPEVFSDGIQQNLL